jgi:hypothetical protein
MSEDLQIHMTVHQALIKNVYEVGTAVVTWNLWNLS